jgi:4-amino-4-deoxy-L-arabinose transferase-like glycosyltransferase
MGLEVTSRPRFATLATWAVLVVAMLIGASLRLTNINAFGYNSDEAVYAGQAAGIVGNEDLHPYVPVFRAHPLLFQFLIALSFSSGVVDVMGRYVSVIIGLSTVWLAYLAGGLMYGRIAGLAAAVFLALMPYHVVVTRQVLLDGPMALWATLALYLLARHAITQRAMWLYAAAGAIGLAFETKETAVILIAAVYAYLALSPEIKVRLRDLVGSAIAIALIVLPFPISLAAAGGGGVTKTQAYFVWQLLRRPNHDLLFYPSVVPPAIGWLVVLTAVVTFIVLARRASWRERLLGAWCVVPLLFFEIWPTKGFQYPIVVAPAVCILAGAGVARLAARPAIRVRKLEVPGRRLATILGVAIAISLVIPSYQAVIPSSNGEFLAGSGGVPGGREAGGWVKEHVPPGGQLLAIGPSMANIIQFYGNRRTYGLSVSTNPLNRNPSYDPIPNADSMIRSNAVQYIVWDSYSAARSTHFSETLLDFVHRYHGRSVHTEAVEVRHPDGAVEARPVIVIYEVRP